MHPSAHLSPSPASLTESLSQQDRAAEPVKPQDDAASDCGMAPTTMSDAEREQAAYRAGVAMQAWYSHYQQTGDARLLDMAYAALGLMKRLLAARSPEYIAQLERERGLDVPACANEEQLG